MVEGEFVLSSHNLAELKRVVSQLIVVNVPRAVLAQRASQALGQMTVGQVAVRFGLEPEQAGAYPERAYPNAHSPRMLTAFTAAYTAIGNCTVRV